MRRHQTTEPMRRCIGCRQSRPQSEMMRFTLNGTDIIADTCGRNEGRVAAGHAAVPGEARDIEAPVDDHEDDGLLHSFPTRRSSDLLEQ